MSYGRIFYVVKIEMSQWNSNFNITQDIGFLLAINAKFLSRIILATAELVKTYITLIEPSAVRESNEFYLYVCYK
ncbi:MAG: hypothetical protein MZV64_36545 [Ignavibacteriales bacterium]|nr:hypothetical protein [Ignavibacteriales bacterium]